MLLLLLLPVQVFTCELLREQEQVAQSDMNNENGRYFVSLCARFVANKNNNEEVRVWLLSEKRLKLRILLLSGDLFQWLSSSSSSSYYCYCARSSISQQLCIACWLIQLIELELRPAEPKLYRDPRQCNRSALNSPVRL